MNRNYKFNQVKIKKFLIKYKTKTLSKKNGFMIVEEDGINKSIYKKIIIYLKKTKNIVFILNIDRIIKLIKNFNFFLSDLNVFSLHKDNVYKSFKKVKH